MANIRCPMCSKTNPPDAETCAFCGARLKPVREPGFIPGQPGAGFASEDEPGWLSGLRSDEGSQPENTESDAPAEPAELASNLPDWLSRIRDRARVETSPSNEPSVPGGSEDPDWMKDLQQASSLQSEESDWLGRLQDNSSADLSPLTPEPETSQVGKSLQPGRFRVRSGYARLAAKPIRSGRCSL